MVVAQRFLNPTTKRELVNVHFDKKMHIKPVVKICSNEQEADSFIEKQYAFAIRTLITRFVKQQTYIISKYPASPGAADKLKNASIILNALEIHSQSQLLVLTSIVYWLKGEIYSLAPSTTSRFRTHYDEFIYPLIDFCFFHSKKIRSKILKHT